MRADHHVFENGAQLALFAPKLSASRRKAIADDDSQALAKLRAMSPEEITDGLNLSNSSGGNPPTFNPGGPIVDGTIVTHVGQAYASGGFRRVRMMIGATSGDMGGRTGFMVGGARARFPARSPTRASLRTTIVSPKSTGTVTRSPKGVSSMAVS